MKFEKTQVWGFERALDGMRNPLESWDRSDSHYETIEEYLKHEAADPIRKYIIGNNDMELAQRLISAGTEHRKFLRQIAIWVDITAPLYWWKEEDTYKIGTTDNSTSTMHTISNKEITIDCFETDDMEDFTIPWFKETIGYCDYYRVKYIATKEKKYWKELIRLLPESWLQKRTISMNYEVVYNMIRQRKKHKLNEWSGMDDPRKKNFVAWAKTLPYAEEFIFCGTD